MIPYLEIPTLRIGPLEIHAFGVLVAIGILVGADRTRHRARQLKLPEEQTTSMITWVVVTGFVVAHLFDVVAYQPDALAERDALGKLFLLVDPRAGLSSFGGFLGALIALLGYTRATKYPLLPAADSLLYGLSYGWFFGRLGCYTAHDHPGAYTTFFLGVPYKNDGVRHDLGFDEALFAFALAAAFTLLSRRWRPPGFFAAITCILYGPLRFGLDFLRVQGVPGADPRYFGLTPAQYGALGVMVTGVVLAAITARRHRAAVAAFAADRARATPEGAPPTSDRGSSP